MGKVLEGDYKGSPIMQPRDMWGNKKEIAILSGYISRLYLNSKTVKSWQVVTESSDKSAISMGLRGVVGGVLLGPAGALLGGATTKSDGMIIAIEFNNGKKSLIQLEKELFAKFKYSTPGEVKDTVQSSVPAPSRYSPPSGPMKTCPYCAETVKAAARLCKHCGKDIPEDVVIEDVVAEIESDDSFPPAPTTNVRTMPRRTPIENNQMMLDDTEPQKRKRGCLRYLIYGFLAFLVLGIIAAILDTDKSPAVSAPKTDYDEYKRTESNNSTSPISQHTSGPRDRDTYAGSATDSLAAQRGDNRPHSNEVSQLVQKIEARSQKNDKPGDPVYTWAVFGLDAVDDSHPPKDLADLKEYTKLFLQNPTNIYQFDLGGLQIYADDMKRLGYPLSNFYHQTKQEGQVHVKQRVTFSGTRAELQKWLAERKKTLGKSASGVPETVDTEFGTFTQDGRQVFGVYNGEKIPDKLLLRQKTEVRWFLEIIGADKQKPMPQVGTDKEFDAFLQSIIDKGMSPYSLYMEATKDCDWLPERTEYIETLDEKHARISLEARNWRGSGFDRYLTRTNAGAWSQ